MSDGEIASTRLAWTYPRPPNSTSPSPARSFSLRSPPGSTQPTTRTESRAQAAVLPRRVAGQFPAVPVGRHREAEARILLVAPRCRGAYALLDEDVTDDLLGQLSIVESQQRLPVQPGGVAVIDMRVPVTGRICPIGREAGISECRHRKLPASRRRYGQEALSATEVRSNYLTLARRDNDRLR